MTIVEITREREYIKQLVSENYKVENFEMDKKNLYIPSKNTPKYFQSYIKDINAIYDKNKKRFYSQCKTMDYNYEFASALCFVHLDKKEGVNYEK